MMVDTRKKHLCICCKIDLHVIFNDVDLHTHTHTHTQTHTHKHIHTHTHK